MKANTIITVSFILSFILTITGAILKIMHLQNAEFILMGGIITNVIYLIFAIIEIINSTKINHREKIMWTIAFVLMTSIAGFIYFFVGRKRVLNKNAVFYN